MSKGPKRKELLRRIAELEAALKPFADVCQPGDPRRRGLGLPGCKGTPSEGATAVWISLGVPDVEGEPPHLQLADFREARRLLQ